MNLLIVEDDSGLRETLRSEMTERGYRVRISIDLPSTREAINGWSVDAAVIDLRLEGHRGIDHLDLIMSAHPRCRAVITTGYGSVATAVEAMKHGAVDYLTKPFTTQRLEEVLQAGTGTRNNSSSEIEHSRETLARHEHEYIEYVLSRCDGNISRAARWLGIHRQSLQRKLRKFPPPR